MSAEYQDAWKSTRIATVQQGLSWSGHEHNHTFLNLGEGRFADVSRLTRCDCEGDGRSAAVVDWDDDGRLDLVLKNRTGTVRRTKTDARGRFGFRQVPIGRYVVLAGKRGVGKDREAIRVRADQVTRVRLRLK